MSCPGEELEVAVLSGDREQLGKHRFLPVGSRVAGQFGRLGSQRTSGDPQWGIWRTSPMDVIIQSHPQGK